MTEEQQAFLGMLTGTDHAKIKVECARLTAKAKNETGIGLNLSHLDLSGKNLSGLDLRRAILRHTTLHGANLDNTNLSKASFFSVGMDKVQARGASFRNTYLHAAAMQACNFEGADFGDLKDAAGSLFHGCNFNKARISGLISGSTFFQCELEEGDLSGIYAGSVSFKSCNMRKINLARAYLYQASIAGETPSSTDVGEATLDDAVLIHARLCADFRKASFVGANCDYANLNQSDFSGADLKGIRLRRASMLKTKFTGAEFPERLMGPFFSEGSENFPFD